MLFKLKEHIKFKQKKILHKYSMYKNKKIKKNSQLM